MIVLKYGTEVEEFDSWQGVIRRLWRLDLRRGEYQIIEEEEV